MKKLTTKLLCLIIALMMSFALVACGDTGNDTGDDNTDDGGSATTEFYNKNEKEEVSLMQGVTFYDGTKSDYKIVIPESSQSSKNDEVTFAAEEIQFFVKDATGFELEIIKDTNIQGLNEDAKYISIGDTKIFNDSDMNGTLFEDILGNDGIKIKTYGKTVVMNSFGENGKLYTAYGFLERIMDFNYYAEDCWTMTEDDVIYMKNMDVVDIPTFNQRQINTGASDDPLYCIRLRQHGQQSQSSELGEWGGWAFGDQSIAREILRTEDYIKTYPSWYWGDGLNFTGQPCLEALLRNYTGIESQKTLYPEDYVGSEYNVEDVKAGKPVGAFEQFMYNMIYVKMPPKLDKTRIFMLGANDNKTACQCKMCLARYEEVKESGQYCIFANRVAEAFEEWQDSLVPGDTLYEYKNKEVTFAFFAYLFAEASPTVYDAQTKTYSPINNDVVLRDDVIARIAPIHSVNMHLHSEELVNGGAAKAFASWNVVSQKLAVWDYGCSFSDALVPYGDWGTLKGNFLMYREVGVEEIFTQLQSRTSGYGLRALKMYCRAELMWDLDQDVYELTENFFKNYYGEVAGKYMMNYYEFLQSVYQTFDVNTIDKGDIYSTDISTSKCFSYNMTKKMGKFFTDALEDIKYLEAEDKELYDKYYNHINCEMLFYDYLMIKNWSKDLTDTECNALCDHFEYWRKIAGLRLWKISSNDTTYDGWVDNYRR